MEKIRTGVKVAIVGNWHTYLRLDIDMFSFSLIFYLFYILINTNITFTTTDTKIKIIHVLQIGPFCEESKVLTI